MGESIVIVIPMTMVVLMKWNVNETTFINSGECIKYSSFEYQFI